MLSILSTRRVALWTRLFKQWLTRKFDSISIDLTPVEEKLDGISEQLDELDVHDENAKHLAEFFGVTLLEGYEFMTDTEVCDELEDIMRVIDPNLTAEQAAAITAQTLNPSES